MSEDYPGGALNRQFDAFRLEVWAIDRSWGLISISI